MVGGQQLMVGGQQFLVGDQQFLVWPTLGVWVNSFWSGVRVNSLCWRFNSSWPEWTGQQFIFRARSGPRWPNPHPREQKDRYD